MVVFFVFTAGNLWGKQLVNYHVIQEKDTLSHIAQLKIGSPIYGKNGSLSKLLSLNPGLNKNSTIIPGDKIWIKGPVIKVQKKKNEHTKAQDNITTKVLNKIKKSKYLSLSSTLATNSNFIKATTSSYETASAISSFSSKITIGIKYHWTSFLDSSINIGLIKPNFKTATNKVLSKSNRLYKDLNLNTSIKSHRNIYHFNIDYIENFFIRSVDKQEISIVENPTVESSLAYERVLFVNSFLASSLKINFGLIIPIRYFDYYFRRGFFYSLELTKTAKLKKMDFNIILTFQDKFLETSLIDYTQRELGLGLQFVF
jgi:hypothetical protein